MPHEFTYSKYTESWKKAAHSALEALIIPSFLEAAGGVEFITGDNLTDHERSKKAEQGGITLASVAVGGLTVHGSIARKILVPMTEEAVENVMYTGLKEIDAKALANTLTYAALAGIGYSIGKTGYAGVSEMMNRRRYNGDYDEAVSFLKRVSESGKKEITAAVSDVNVPAGNIAEAGISESRKLDVGTVSETRVVVIPK